MMDGELDSRGFAQAFDALSRDSEASEAWRTYHLISDAMRDSPMLSEGFAAQVAERLASQPTVVAPGRIASLQRRSWWALSAAASVAAVALVGWMALGPQQPGSLQAPMAQTEPAHGVAQAQLASAKPPVMVPPPAAANDYLLAHQGFSPRVWLQGMAPYVRTVSEPAAGTRK